MTTGRARYIRRNLLTGLKQVGFQEDACNSFADNLLDLLRPDASPPDDFFDIGRAIRVLANMESLNYHDAREMLIHHPEKMLEIYDLPTEKKPSYPRLKYHPTREERVLAAIAVRDKYGSLPYSRNCDNGEHECLPPNSIGWTYILRIYYHDKGVILSDDVADYERGKSNAPDPAMPSDYKIYKRAMLYMAKNNAMPPPIKKRMVGKNSPYWEDIHSYLEKRGMTMGGLIASQQSKQIKGTAHLRQPSLLPTNEEIGRWGVEKRYHLGLIPVGSETFSTLDNRTITAGKLKERLIKERKTTLTSLMDAFEKANPLYTPPLQARTVFLLAASCILEHGTLPDQRKNNVMMGDFSALGINKQFTHDRIEGAEIFRLSKWHMRNLRSFLLATGLAEKAKGGELIPAPREKIEKLVLAYAP